MSKRVVITRPDDWHVHFRDKALLAYTAKATAEYFHRALVMPNLKPPLTTIDALVEYRARILENTKTFPQFEPYLTFYLNDAVSAEALASAKKHSWILGAKLYPSGVTTNAEAGPKSIEALYPLLDIMSEQDLVLQIHGEVRGGDIFEREPLFLEEHLKNILHNFPKLRMVLEHISTRAAVQFVENAKPNLAATITPHHLLYNRNQLLSGGIKPHYYCLPILKHADDQKAIQAAAVSGNPKFFAGTDSAPHPKEQKECASGCAGIYSAPFALSMYAEVFDKLNALDKLDAFLGRYGAAFYHLPVSKLETELVQKPITVPNLFQMGQLDVVPIHAGGQFEWSVV